MDHQEESSSYQCSNIILPMNHHHPINGASTSSSRMTSTKSCHWIINEESSSYQWSINMILLMDHQRRIIVLSMEHQHNPTNGSSTKNYRLINGAST
ncbi:hypothetical protein KY289_013782 [Solanum tuberosum]|nr:hypothetical protein KY289_013782 [Solanum tuberosum]